MGAEFPRIRTAGMAMAPRDSAHAGGIGLSGRRLGMPPIRLLGRRALRSAGGEPRCPADSVRPFTPAVHLPVRPWSPRSQSFPREADAARTVAPRRPAVTSGAAPRRHRSTKSSPRISRAGSPGEKPPSGPCRDTSRTNSAAISSAGSSASASPAPGARAAARDSSWHSPARAAASARPATVGTWPRHTECFPPEAR